MGIGIELELLLKFWLLFSCSAKTPEVTGHASGPKKMLVNLYYQNIISNVVVDL